MVEIIKYGDISFAVVDKQTKTYNIKVENDEVKVVKKGR